MVFHSVLLKPLHCVDMAFTSRDKLMYCQISLQSIQEVISQILRSNGDLMTHNEVGYSVPPPNMNQYQIPTNETIYFTQNQEENAVQNTTNSKGGKRNKGKGQSFTMSNMPEL